MSYDFESLIKGVAVLNGKYQYKLFFIGDGVCRAKVENLINQYSVNAEITGFLKPKVLMPSTTTSTSILIPHGQEAIILMADSTYRMPVSAIPPTL